MLSLDGRHQMVSYVISFVCLNFSDACLGLVHGDDPQRCYGEGGGRGVHKKKKKKIKCMDSINILPIYKNWKTD